MDKMRNLGIMTWLNNDSISMSIERHRNHPVLSCATVFLQQFVEMVDQHSDGWAYWPKPARAATRLMNMINHPETASENELKLSVRTVRMFCTRFNLLCPKLLTFKELCDGRRGIVATTDPVDDELQRLQAIVARADELQRLRAIVARLAKSMTGEPIIQGDTVYIKPAEVVIKAFVQAVCIQDSVVYLSLVDNTRLPDRISFIGYPEACWSRESDVPKEIKREKGRKGR